MKFRPIAVLGLCVPFASCTHPHAYASGRHNNLQFNMLDESKTRSSVAVVAHSHTKHAISEAPGNTQLGEAEENRIGAFTSRLVLDQGEFMRRAYEVVAKSGSKSTTIREMIYRTAHPPASGVRIVLTEGYFKSGEFSGYWNFYGPEGQLPTRAWRNLDMSDENRFFAEKIGYCTESLPECKSWFDLERHLAAPPHEAITAATSQWSNRVLEEPCQPGPASKPPMDVLNAQLGRTTINEVVAVLETTLNPCGDVRGVRLVRSSNNLFVDDALVEWILQSRLTAPTKATRKGARGIVPVTLVIESSSQKQDGLQSRPVDLFDAARAKIVSKLIYPESAFFASEFLSPMLDEEGKSAAVCGEVLWKNQDGKYGEKKRFLVRSTEDSKPIIFGSEVSEAQVLGELLWSALCASTTTSSSPAIAP